MALKDDIKKLKTGLKTQQDQTLPGSHVVTPVPARSYPTSPIAFEDGTSFNTDVRTINNNFRPMWNTRESAIQQNKVTTLNLPKVTQALGIAVSPTMTSTKLVSLPNMTVGLAGTAGVQIQVAWQFSGSLTPSSAVASFALFRDGLQIAPTMYGSNSNGKFTVTGSYVDAPLTGLHAYSLYGAVSAGTLTADGKSRLISALPLKPQ